MNRSQVSSRTESLLIDCLPTVMAGCLALACGMLTACENSDPGTTTDFPARETPNYQALVSAGWVKSLIDHQKSGFQTLCPPTYRQQPVVILEASWATLEKAREYHAGHLP
ncbi:MAG: hypothetical protein FJ405_08930, partial [Verrucomicrobia bacterium]|nr:hypothetical protein [Verrucomicrobiota bacterium]